MPRPKVTPRRKITTVRTPNVEADIYEGDYSHPVHGTREHGEVQGKEDGVNREFEAYEGDYSHPAHGTADPDAV